MTEPITLCELELPKEYKPGTIVEHFKRQHSLTQDEIKTRNICIGLSELHSIQKHRKNL